MKIILILRVKGWQKKKEKEIEAQERINVTKTKTNNFEKVEERGLFSCFDLLLCTGFLNF